MTNSEGTKVHIKMCSLALSPGLQPSFGGFQTSFSGLSCTPCVHQCILRRRRWLMVRITVYSSLSLKSLAMSGSVSWLEWTQQLQAYIAWVNSQLRKRPELRPVQDLRTDLQSGEVLAQLIEIISGEKIAGIQYAPESLQGL